MGTSDSELLNDDWVYFCMICLIYMVIDIPHCNFSVSMRYYWIVSFKKGGGFNFSFDHAAFYTFFRLACNFLRVVIHLGFCVRRY